MKKKVLTRKLIIASIAWLLLIGVGVGAYFWLSDELEFYERETINNTSSLQANITQQESTAKNIKQSENANKLYEEYAFSTENDKNQYRENALVRTLSDITKELGTVRVSFIAKSFDKYPTIPGIDGVEVTYNPIIMKFEALSDIAAFQVLALLKERLSGKIYIKEFSIEKIKDIDSSILLEISNGKMPYLVKGNMQFDWIQIRVEPPATPTVVPQETQAPLENQAPQEPVATEQGINPVAPVAPAVNAGGQDV